MHQPPFPPGPATIQHARQALLEAAQSLIDLLTGPAEHLRWLACRHHDMSSLRWIYHFKIAPAIPLDRAISYAEVAAETDVDVDHLTRMLRHAMTNRLFTEPEPGMVAHTAPSALLVTTQALNDWVGYTTEETFPASATVVEAQERFGASLSPTETEYNVAFGTPKPMFAHMAEDPERERRFANTMAEMTSTEGYGIHHLVEGYGWDEIGKAKVIDARQVDHQSVLGCLASNVDFVGVGANAGIQTCFKADIILNPLNKPEKMDITVQGPRKSGLLKMLPIRSVDARHVSLRDCVVTPTVQYGRYICISEY
ncbi:hypothetical protein BDW66DRAFT_154155 [Aspergillus desertorum]